METIPLRGEKSLSELIKRVYGVVSDDSTSKLLEEAFLRDNPHLSAMKNLPVGSLIKVPAIDGITPARAEIERTEDPKVEVAAQARIDLSSYLQQLEKAINQEIADIEKQLGILDEVAKKTEGIGQEQIVVLIANLKQRYKDLEKRQKEIESSL